MLKMVNYRMSLNILVKWLKTYVIIMQGIILDFKLIKSSGFIKYHRQHLLGLIFVIWFSDCSQYTSITYNICPLTKSEAFEARKIAAPFKSSGLPHFPAGVRLIINSLNGCPSVRIGQSVQLQNILGRCH